MTDHVTVRRASSLDDAIDNAPAWRPAHYSGDIAQTVCGGAVVVTCPSGHTTTLHLAIYAVDPRGSVVPSIICPRPGCSWHVLGRLEDWAND